MSCMTIFFYKQVQISSSDIRPHIKWAVSLVILHMVTSISLQGLCGYIWVNILTLSPQRVFSPLNGHVMEVASSMDGERSYRGGQFNRGRMIMLIWSV